MSIVRLILSDRRGWRKGGAALLWNAYKIRKTIGLLRNERYRWTPVRRINIPKKNGKMRPLGIPTWPDKLLQEVMRSILDAYYEPQFSPNSHGFRPEKGCHTALKDIFHGWTGIKWFIEGDIKGCFDNIDHTVLMSILREKIHDNRFLILVENLLKAGYLEQWTYRPTLSGTPQGGIISPLLANIGCVSSPLKFVSRWFLIDFRRYPRFRQVEEVLPWTTTSPASAVRTRAAPTTASEPSAT